MTGHLSEYQKITRDFYEANSVAYAANTAAMLDEEWLMRFSAQLPPQARVLDVGSAAGRDSRWFAEKGYAVTGIDIAPSFVASARALVPRAEFRCMDVLKMSFQDGTFDGIWCSCVLIHFTKSDAQLAINEMVRVLKAGGVLYLLVKTGSGEGYEEDRRYGGMRKYSAYFTKDELLGMIADLEIIDSTSVDKPVDSYRATDRLFVLARKPMREEIKPQEGK